MRIVFAGAGAFGIPGLRALSEMDEEITAVLSWPDRPKGRGRKLCPTPIARAAEELHLPVLKMDNTFDMASGLARLEADLLLERLFVLRELLAASGIHFFQPLHHPVQDPLGLADGESSEAVHACRYGREHSPVDRLRAEYFGEESCATRALDEHPRRLSLVERKRGGDGLDAFQTK